MIIIFIIMIIIIIRVRVRVKVKVKSNSNNISLVNFFLDHLQTRAPPFDGQLLPTCECMQHLCHNANIHGNAAWWQRSKAQASHILTTTSSYQSLLLWEATNDPQIPKCEWVVQLKKDVVVALMHNSFLVLMNTYCCLVHELDEFSGFLLLTCGIHGLA